MVAARLGITRTTRLVPRRRVRLAVLTPAMVEMYPVFGWASHSLISGNTRGCTLTSTRMEPARVFCLRCSVPYFSHSWAARLMLASISPISSGGKTPRFRMPSSSDSPSFPTPTMASFMGGSLAQGE